MLYSGEWMDATSSMSEIQVAIDGNDMYIQGLAYYFEDGWIKGTIDGGNVIFPCGQCVGEDDYGPEYIVGSEDGSEISDIVFEYDEENGVLTSSTTYIIENAEADEVAAYAYWDRPVFSTEEPEKPQAVVLPEGAEVMDYVMTYYDDEDKEASKSVMVAVVGNDVYIQGFSEYMPKAWVKGTKDGNTVTFPGEQYVGTYASSYDSYFFYEGDVVFTYDPDTESYSANGEIYGVLDNQYLDGYYVSPVLTKVNEVAATPATPSITKMEESEIFGWKLFFDIPLEDTEGNLLAASKLYYQLFADVDGEVTPLTFTPATHDELTEDMTVFPYGFTDDWDFYADEIFLNGVYSEDWDKVGIQSIYLGGGEERKSEIGWFTIEKPVEEIEIANSTFDVAADFQTESLATTGDPNNLPVTGWTSNGGAAWSVGGVFAYGSEAQLNGVAAPATDMYEKAEGGALGISVGWSGVVAYTQELTLAAGNYRLTADAYNANLSATQGASQLGFVTESQSFLSTRTSFPSDEWVTDEVVFTLTEETTGNIQIGLGAVSGGSGSNAKVFFDNVTLTPISDAELAKIELKNAINAAADQYKSYAVGDGLFQYASTELDPLAFAISDAISVYVNEGATKEQVETATTTLNAYVEAFEPALTTPDSDQAYMLTLTTSEGDFQLSATAEGIKIAEEGTPIYFVPQAEGTFAIYNGEEFVNYEGSNNWTMSTSGDAYGWTITCVSEGQYTIAGKNGMLGTNTSDGNAAGSPCYGDKTTSNGNCLWTITEYTPAPEMFIWTDDFEDAEKEGVSIVGAGAIVDDETPGFGKVYENVGGAVRTNYLLLPSDLLSHSAETKELSISFWVNANGNDAGAYAYAPFFTAYAAKNSPNTWPMLALQSRGPAQVNCAGWTDFTGEDNVDGKNNIYNQNAWEAGDAAFNFVENWLDDGQWHFYVANFTETGLTIYLDGVVKNQWTLDGTEGHTLNGLFSNGAELQYICLGGNQAWDWNDGDSPFRFDDVTVANYVMPEDIMAELYAAKAPSSSNEADELVAPEGWTQLVTNGNLAGDDIHSYLSKEAPSDAIVGARIVAGAGKDGSRGIEVAAAAQVQDPWESQVWIVLDEALPEGSSLHVEFDYKANQAATVGTQAHGVPGEYQHWSALGDVNFTTEWQHFSKDITVDASMAKGDNGNGDGIGVISIAFNLSQESKDVVYNFDNFGVWSQAPVPVDEWTDLIVNGTMEGDDMSCFYVTEQGIGGPYLAYAFDGIGVDGSKAVRVQSADGPANDWDTQFFIRLPYELPAGTKYKLSFDYKADVAGGCDTQSHNEPGQYIHWACAGSPSFTTEWQSYSYEGNVLSECDGTEDTNSHIMKNFQTIAFNLAKNGVATNFIFDNVKFEIPANVAETLTPTTAENTDPYRVGIDQLVVDAENAAIFDLTGRRVDNVLKGGLYIINGKKVFVK